MLLTVLGCSGSAPGPNAPTSGYLLEADGFLLGLELGNGTLAALQAIRDPRTHRLPVYGPSEMHSRFVAAHSPDAADQATTDLSDVYDFRVLCPNDVHIGPFEVTVIRAAHPCESFCFRFSHAGRSLAFTGDTGAFDGLADLASDADVLLSEASWTHADDRPVALHLSGKEAGELAKRSGAGQLLVTHVPPWTDAEAVLAEARAEYPGEIVLVSQGATYQI